jgi:glyoxylase-like metal-dependent hydrolase (beta-lactamase superfamily II)
MSKLNHLPGEYAPFQQGYDLLADESVIAVELPGHAIGQMGLFVRAEDDRLLFFVADAAWLKQAIVENRPPHRIADLLFADGKTYRDTLSNLHAYHSRRLDVEIVPSHCEETITRYERATR